MTKRSDRFRWVLLQLAIIFPRSSQRISPISNQKWLKKLEDQSISTEKSLNEAYETVYNMNIERGIYEKKITMATFRWLLACKTLLDATEVLQLIMITLQNDPDLEEELSEELSKPLDVETILYVSV